MDLRAEHGDVTCQIAATDAMHMRMIDLEPLLHRLFMSLCNRDGLVCARTEFNVVNNAFYPLPPRS